ncbi:MAG: HAD-IIIA family hydrolase [Saprospiraceae bacterium]|nr:HAD-IIIA family hydrolase [Saprospiraceae bacterium]
MNNYKELLKEITTFFFDYDGVLTDGNVFLSSQGDLIRSSNVKDGYALQLAIRLGYKVVILTGGKSKQIKKRFENLNLKDIFIAVEDKLKPYENYIKKHNLQAENVLYMGDDIPDYPVMKRVGVACCPADAVEEIKNISVYISDYKGGQGCVRDVIEQVLKVKGEWMKD